MPTEQPTILLDPFELFNPIGQGAMGQVWRGRHTDSGVPVAIKVITGGMAAHREYQEAFRREVQAIAGVRHPGIISVYDYGTLPVDLAGSSDGLVAGSPWLAMELADRGSLGDRLPLTNWGSVYCVLQEVLAALAHAHARRIVHRDLKPGNILLCSTSDGERYKLTDFGIALATDPDASQRTADVSSPSAGTPAYMAPEQFEGHWRDCGPWTDLYALGCVAFQLVCGRQPYFAIWYNGEHCHRAASDLSW